MIVRAVLRLLDAQDVGRTAIAAQQIGAVRRGQEGGDGIGALDQVGQILAILGDHRVQHVVESALRAQQDTHPFEQEIVHLGGDLRALALRRLAPRGAAGCDPCTSDGAGVLLQIPHAFLERVTSRRGLELPNAGDYGVAQAFLSRDPTRRAAEMRALEDAVRYHNQKVIGWRDVPVDATVLGPLARSSQPVFKQLFIARMCNSAVFERTLFMIRKRAGRMAAQAGLFDFYLASCSSRTVVYKGLALPELLHLFYTDLAADDLRSTLALVHSRFSTNTFPTWERAHPYRRIAHNGEITARQLLLQGLGGGGDEDRTVGQSRWDEVGQ